MDYKPGEKVHIFNAKWFAVLKGIKDAGVVEGEIVKYNGGNDLWTVKTGDKEKAVLGKHIFKEARGAKKKVFEQLKILLESLE